MKILMIGTDRKLFEENSAVRQRIVEYGNLVDGLYVIVFSKQAHFEKRLIGRNTWVYPTNSANKFMYMFDAMRIGRQIIGKNLNRDKIADFDPFPLGCDEYFTSREQDWKVNREKKRAQHAENTA